MKKLLPSVLLAALTFTTITAQQSPKHLAFLNSNLPSSRINSDKSSPPNNSVLWRSDVLCQYPNHVFYSAPAITDRIVYVQCSSQDEWASGDAINLHSLSKNENYLFALDARTGKVKWRFKAAASPDVFKRVQLFWPKAADGLVFLGSNQGGGFNEKGDASFYAFEGETGKVRWKHDMPGRGLGYDYQIVEGVVYLSDLSGKLYALDAQTGKVKWDFQTTATDPLPAPFSIGSVQAINNMVVMSTIKGVIHALDKSTGQQKWERKLGDGASLSVDGTELYAIIRHGRSSELVRLDLTNGLPTLIKKLPSETNAWLTGQTLYEIGKTKMSATDLQTNQEKWSRSKDYGCDILQINEQSIYFTCNDRVVHAVDLRTGAKSLQIKTKLWRPAPPATANGVTYIAGDNNRLYALK